MSLDPRERQRLRTALRRVEEVERLLRELLGEPLATGPEHGASHAAEAPPVPEARAGIDRDLIRAIDSRERTFRFIALTYFRDRVLPEIFPALSSEERHALLNRALHEGWLTLDRVPNPARPSRPTASLRLDRRHPLVVAELGSATRFAPVPIRGVPLSETVLEDRR